MYGTGTKSNPYVIEGTQPVTEIVGGGGGGAGRLIGEIITFAGDDTKVPPGWEICRGQPLSRANYANLYGIIGDAYGAGDGVNTFNVPDFSGRCGIGVGSTGPQGQVLRGAKGGAHQTKIATGHLVAHAHYNLHGHAGVQTHGSSLGAPTVGTGGEGNHQHNLAKAASTGNYGGTMKMGDTTVSSLGMGGIETSGWHGHAVTIPDHTHAVYVPNYDGNTYDGGGVAAAAQVAFPTMPPFLAVQRLIYHGVGVDNG